MIVQNHGEPPIRVSSVQKSTCKYLLRLYLEWPLASSLHTAIVFIFPLLDN